MRRPPRGHLQLPRRAIAREQQKSVADSKVRLNDLKDLIKSAAEKGRRDVFKDEQLAQVDSFITLLEGRPRKRPPVNSALAALRKASASGLTAPSKWSATGCPTFGPRPTVT